jgi:hypothetical protein
MKPAALVLCLLATVASAWAGQRAGKCARTPCAAPIPRVREVRFTGELAFERGTLRKVLRELEVRHVIPGIWTRRPLYEARAVEAALTRLRSFYFSHGYFDASVGVGDVTIERGDAILTLDVQSGPRYAVLHVEIEGVIGEHRDATTKSSGEFPVDTLCTCLLDSRRTAESAGRIDFDVELLVSHNDGPALPGTGQEWVDVTARVDMGSAYAVGRIDFWGHHRINESTLRRAMVLQERSTFEVGKLRASLARLNRSGLFEPLTMHDVEIVRNPDTLTADLTIAIRERPRRRWSLCGQAGPSALRLLEASISSRLPPWGRGVLEASTYYLTFSMMGFSNPLIRLLPIRVRPSLPALLVLERPYLPGQALFSGFALSPQLSARSMLEGYGLTHLDRAVQEALRPADSDRSTSPGRRGRPLRGGQAPHLQSGGIVAQAAAPRSRDSGRSGARRVSSLLVPKVNPGFENVLCSFISLGLRGPLEPQRNATSPSCLIAS